MSGFQSGQDGALLPARDYVLCPARKICSLSHRINPEMHDQACSVKVAGYWPRSFFWRVYGARLCLGP